MTKIKKQGVSSPDETPAKPKSEKPVLFYYIHAESDCAFADEPGKANHEVSEIGAVVFEPSQKDFERVCKAAGVKPPFLTLQWPREAKLETPAPTLDPPPEKKPYGRFTAMSYGRTINLGNYENFRLEMTVELTAEDHPGHAYETLVKTVDAKCHALKNKKQPAN